MKSLYNEAVKYLHSKYPKDAPLDKYTPTDSYIKMLLREYNATGGAKLVRENLKTAMDYVWLWKAARAYESIEAPISTMSYNEFLNKFENRIFYEYDDTLAKMKYRGVIFTIHNVGGQAVLYGAFECFDCLDNSFGEVRYLDIPESDAVYV